MEYDLLDRRRHPHPLLFEMEGKYDGLCCRCRLPLLHKPSFHCSHSDCNFRIHRSCIHLPDEIHSHLHPQHPLSLIEFVCCYACGQIRSSREYDYYCCTICKLVIDTKCAMANTKLCQTSNGKYVHMSHPQHPLTLALSPPLEQRQQNGGEIKNLLDCAICKWLIEPGSSTNYFCSQCDDDGDFHKECAELPMQLKIPVHSHPLFLLKCSHNDRTPCHVCRNECEGFTYVCLECSHFQLHIPCLQSYGHKHKFTKLQIITEFTCSVCGEKSKDRFVVCNICHMLVHEKCVEFPSTLRIYEHHLQ